MPGVLALLCLLACASATASSASISSATTASTASSASTTSVSAAAASTPRSLPPGPLIVGYGTAACDQEKMISEAMAGVNVIIWFATNLVKGADGRPEVVGGQNHTCVAEVARELRRRKLPTAHMISIGGWDAPHPDTSFSGTQWWVAWDAWNQATVADKALGFPGYDGIDWDLEGNDASESVWNTFTAECVELVGTMSQAAKRAGFLVSLVPPQSYTDPTISGFDRSLRHSYSDWKPDFHYRGMNAYAVWLSSRYSAVQVNNKRVPTFDFVDVQLYETWSRASFAIDGPPQTPPAQYLVELVRSFAKGWSVDFSSDPTVGVPTQNVSIPPKQLVLGFSRGSENGSGKSVFIWPKDVGEAFAALAEDERPLGVMFWNMEIDGRRDHGTGVNGTNVTCDQAAEFNKFLRVRT